VILRWTERAAEHLEMLHAYIAGENPSAADTLLDRVVESAERLAQFPNMGRCGRVSGTRELVLPGTQILLAYRVLKGGMQILAVLHAARRWPDSF
jgi:toxin ParE1/3/4